MKRKIIADIVIPYGFHKLNECLSAAHGEGRYYANIKKKDTRIASEHANKFMIANQGIKYPLSGHYDLLLDWNNSNARHDHDNISFGIKFILDGFVNAGLLANDTQRYIGNIFHRFELDRETPDSVRIRLIEV